MATEPNVYQPCQGRIEGGRTSGPPMLAPLAKPSPVERHYTAGEVADLWRLDVETIRRLFNGEPGIVVLKAPTRKGKRAYRTIRIPQSVLDRVHQRLQS